MAHASKVTITVPDDAYNASTWNGSVEVPTKNAVRDKIESLALGGSTGLVYTNSSVPAGNTITSTSETAFTSSYSLPLDQLSVGDLVKIRLFGHYSGTVLPTITGKIKIGTTVLLSTGVVSGLATGTNMGWWADAYFIVQSTGASGTIEAQGYAEFATAATTGLSVNLVNAAAITVDTTAAQTITVTIQWGAGGTGQTITLREMAIYVGKLAGIASGVADGDKGDITVTGGGVVWNIDNGSVTNAKLANMAASTFKMRVTGSTGAPEDGTAAQAKVTLALDLVDNTSNATERAATATLTNKRNQKRVYSAANNASVTPEIATYDIFALTAMSAATTINNHSSSTPADGEMMLFRYKDNGTARTIAHGTNYTSKNATMLTTTTISKQSRELFEWNASTSKFECVFANTEA